MRGRRPEKPGSVILHPPGPKCAETHSLPVQYVEDFFG